MGGGSDEVGVVNTEDRQRFSERAQRFGKQGTADGNKNYKKKVSIDELLKRTVVSSSHFRCSCHAPLAYRRRG